MPHRIDIKGVHHSSVRQGCGIKWESRTAHGHHSGFRVDHLDKKKLEESESTFERLFILVRTEMERNASRCMDDENDRLALCQAISDRVYKDFKSSLEGKVG